jgi:hypothetical protein
MPSRKTTIHDREIKRYRLRLSRTVGLYLAMFAWKAGLDGVVLMRQDIQEFFGIDNTGRPRMDQIIENITPWFRYSKVYHREKSDTYVHYLFLSKSELELHIPSSQSLSQDKEPKRRTVVRVLDAMGQTAPRLRLFASLVEEMPKQSDIIADLALFTAGVKTPKIKAEA